MACHFLRSLDQVAQSWVLACLQDSASHLHRLVETLIGHCMNSITQAHSQHHELLLARFSSSRGSQASPAEAMVDDLAMPIRTIQRDAQGRIVLRFSMAAVAAATGWSLPLLQRHLFQLQDCKCVALKWKNWSIGVSMPVMEDTTPWRAAVERLAAEIHAMSARVCTETRIKVLRTYEAMKQAAKGDWETCLQQALPILDAERSSETPMESEEEVKEGETEEVRAEKEAGDDKEDAWHEFDGPPPAEDSSVEESNQPSKRQRVSPRPRSPEPHGSEKGTPSIVSRISDYFAKEEPSGAPSAEEMGNLKLFEPISDSIEQAIARDTMVRHLESSECVSWVFTVSATGFSGRDVLNTARVWRSARSFNDEKAMRSIPFALVRHSNPCRPSFHSISRQVMEELEVRRCVGLCFSMHSLKFICRHWGKYANFSFDEVMTVAAPIIEKCLKRSRAPK